MGKKWLGSKGGVGIGEVWQFKGVEGLAAGWEELPLVEDGEDLEEEDATVGAVGSAGSGERGNPDPTGSVGLWAAAGSAAVGVGGSSRSGRGRFQVNSRGGRSRSWRSSRSCW